jgi:RNA polymerase sigma-70 factor, ECF subfamily
MCSHSNESSGDLSRSSLEDPTTLAEVFEQYRPRLRKMIKLRLDRRLQGRVDPSDVLQEAYLEIARRAPELKERPEMPLFLWLRMMTGQKLLEFHRRHLGAQLRDVRREITLYSGPLPQASSVSLAAYLLGHLTSASQVAQRAELQIKLQESLNNLDPIDREVLTLRHFEELTNTEVAQVLGLAKNAASNRYVRALARLREVLEEIPGFFD